MVPSKCLSRDLVFERCKSSNARQPVAKKIATASGLENYNLLQNNGRLAHQVVDHVRLSPAVTFFLLT